MTQLKEMTTFGGNYWNNKWQLFIGMSIEILNVRGLKIIFKVDVLSFQLLFGMNSTSPYRSIYIYTHPSNKAIDKWAFNRVESKSNELNST